MNFLEQVQAVLKSEHKGRMIYQENPMPFVVRHDLVAPVGNGLFVLKGALAAIVKKVDSCLESLAREVGAETVLVPHMLSWQNAEASNYLKSFKNQAYPICSFDMAQEDAYVLNAQPEGLLSPTVCYHYFSSLKNKSVQKSHLITAVGKCARKEEGTLDTLGRLANFTMREIVFFGDEQFCREQHNSILAKTVELFNLTFDLSYAVVTASDPFFGKNSEVKKKSQLLSQSKYEVQARLPYNNSALSVASFNLHGGVFYDRFSIKPHSDAAKFSGCVGWGYERILYALLAQKGVDFTSPFYQELLK